MVSCLLLSLFLFLGPLFQFFFSFLSLLNAVPFGVPPEATLPLRRPASAPLQNLYIYTSMAESISIQNNQIIEYICTNADDAESLSWLVPRGTQSCIL